MEKRAGHFSRLVLRLARCVGAACFFFVFGATAGRGQGLPGYSPMSTGVAGLSAYEKVDLGNQMYLGSRNLPPNVEYWLSVANDPSIRPGHLITLQITILASTNSHYGPTSPQTFTETFDSSYAWYFQPDGFTPRAYGPHLRAYFAVIGDQITTKAADNRAAVEAGKKIPATKSEVPGATYTATGPVHLSDAGANPIIVNAEPGAGSSNRRGNVAPPSGKKIINADSADPSLAQHAGPSSRPGMKIINSDGDDAEPTPRQKKKKARSSL